MFRKILKKDIGKNKVITAALCLFILLSALLVSGASIIITELTGSMGEFFKASDAPHYVQTHSGELDQDEIDRFVMNHEEVTKQQTAEMLNIDGSNIYLGDQEQAEQNSVIDIGFVTQNDSFDYLLDMKNKRVDIKAGEVGVPVYYMQKNNLQLGDQIWIKKDGFEMPFTITAFIRDVQMNPSVISSKRFVVYDTDWEYLKENIGDLEYLIEFQLTDAELVAEFSQAYENAGLPAKGQEITYSLYQLTNALTDGIIAAVIILVSLLLIIIAMLCLRFTIMAGMEEDYREIGVMKAIGIPHQKIKDLYMAKYTAMAAAASGLGYIGAVFAGRLFTENISLYMGNAPKSVLSYLIPVVGAFSVFLIITLFCRFILRRFRNVSAVGAMREGSSAQGGHSRFFFLRRSKILGVNAWLGCKDILSRFRVYGLLCFVFVLCSFIIIVPVNLLNTMESPQFISYMGIGESDIHIDIRESEEARQTTAELESYLHQDQEIERFAAFTTCNYKVLNADGIYSTMKIETGDFSKFPLEYSEGNAPIEKDQIALSYLNAQESGWQVGDEVRILIEGREQRLEVCGIYQDITNGGKTAKASIAPDYENVLWNVISVKTAQGISGEEKAAEYNSVFPSAQVTSIEAYLTQTLSATLKQLRLAVYTGIGIALLIGILITALFLKMLIAKDKRQIIIMKSIGFTTRDIRKQYIMRSAVALAIGIILGTAAANTLGQQIASLAGSMLGAAHITFVIQPFIAYGLCPLLLAGIVLITTWISTLTIGKNDDLKMTAE